MEENLITFIDKVKLMGEEFRYYDQTSPYFHYYISNFGRLIYYSGGEARLAKIQKKNKTGDDNWSSINSKLVNITNKDRLCVATILSVWLDEPGTSL
jgi:hypothetical protein